jgi:hypothetical protein
MLYELKIFSFFDLSVAFVKFLEVDVEGLRRGFGPHQIFAIDLLHGAVFGGGPGLVGKLFLVDHVGAGD